MPFEAVMLNDSVGSIPIPIPILFNTDWIPTQFPIPRFGNRPSANGDDVRAKNQDQHILSPLQCLVVGSGCFIPERRPSASSRFLPSPPLLLHLLT